MQTRNMTMSITKPFVAILRGAIVQPTLAALAAHMSSAMATTTSTPAVYGYVHHACITAKPSIAADTAMKERIFPSFDHNSTSPLTNGQETSLLVYNGCPSSCSEEIAVMKSKVASLEAQLVAGIKIPSRLSSTSEKEEAVPLLGSGGRVISSKVCDEASGYLKEGEMNFPLEVKQRLIASRKERADEHKKQVLRHCAERIQQLIIQKGLNLTYQRAVDLHLHVLGDVLWWIYKLSSRNREAVDRLKYVLGDKQARIFRKMLDTELDRIGTDWSDLITKSKAVQDGLAVTLFSVYGSVPYGWDAGTSEEWSHLYEYATVIRDDYQAAVRSMLQLYVKLRKECRHDPPVKFPDPVF
jgi:hypothetical protein